MRIVSARRDLPVHPLRSGPLDRAGQTDQWARRALLGLRDRPAHVGRRGLRAWLLDRLSLR